MAVCLACAVPVAAQLDLRQLEQPVSANFKDVDFEAAVQFLGETAGVTMVLSPKAQELGKPVSLHLVDVPLNRALEYLVEGQGLVYKLEEASIYIASLDELEAEPVETRVFFLEQGPGLFANFEPMSETRQSVALQAAGINRMTTLKDVLEEVVPPVGSSSMLLEEKTGALIVTHVPYYLQQIEQLLAKLDVEPVEVRIETRFIELTLEDTDEWNFDASLTADASLTKTDASGDRQGPGLKLASTGASLLRGTKVDFTSFTRQTSGDGLNLTLQGILTGTRYQAILHMLMETEKTKTLSAPQITTLNNQTATIKIITEFVYASRYEASVTREDLNSDGDFLDTVSGEQETEFVNVPQDFVTRDLGILLNVTPSVGHDLKTITLALKPEVSERKTTDEFGGGVSFPRFTARNLETTVVIETGETVVLGGLMKDTVGHTVTGVPGLKRIPVLGKLFTKRSETLERSNLLIFVTASIVRSDPKLAQQTQ